MIWAFLLTFFAGLSTGIGSILALFAKSTNKKFLAVSLGFSAGVMLYVSMIEIFQKAKAMLALELGERAGAWVCVLAFFAGMVLLALIDRCIPTEDAFTKFEDKPKALNMRDGQLQADKEQKNKEQEEAKLLRMGIFTALAIAVHNFPEGLATFVSALSDPTIAIPIVAAIAIHNIPEGIAVSVPIYQATGSKKKAFLYSFLSGLAEPIGAVIGWLLLLPVMNAVVYGITFASVAGIMVFLSLDELLPAAWEYEKQQVSVYGLAGGMAVMALSLLLFI